MPENQLLAAALRAAEPRVRDLGVRNDARVFGSIMAEVCDARTRDADWYSRTIRYGRRNTRYRPAHELAKIVLKGLALTDRIDKSTVNLASFMVDMNAVFEQFVTRLVSESLAGTNLRAHAQQTVRAVILDEESGETYSRIRPDLIIEDMTTGRTVPIDVKYKLYSDKKLSSADIYQSFVYAYAVDGYSSAPRAGLIYPSMNAKSGPALRVKPLVDAQPARIRGAGIAVAAILDALSDLDKSHVYAEIIAMIREVAGLHQESAINI